MVHSSAMIKDIPSMSPKALPLIDAPTTTAAAFSPIRTFIISTVFSLAATAVAIGYAEYLYQMFAWFYRTGRVKRYYPLPSKRNYGANSLSALSFIYPTSLVYFFAVAPRASAPISWNFNPINVVLSTICYMILHDFWFYYVHRHSHFDKWVWNFMHAMHHEYDRAMNVFVVGYADMVENFIQVGLPWMAWVAIYHTNVWNMLLPFSFVLFTTLAGHSGSQMCTLAFLMHPLILPISLIFGKHLLTPSDHQVHHTLRRYNFGLFFRWQDKMHGTYRKSDLKAQTAEHWSEQLKKGEYKLVGKKSADFKSNEPLEYEELDWGF